MKTYKVLFLDINTKTERQIIFYSDSLKSCSDVFNFKYPDYLILDITEINF